MDSLQTRMTKGVSTVKTFILEACVDPALFREALLLATSELGTLGQPLQGQPGQGGAGSTWFLPRLCSRPREVGLWSADLPACPLQGSLLSQVRGREAESSQHLPHDQVREQLFGRFRVGPGL